MLGALKIDELFKATTPERLLRFQAKMNEHLLSHIFPSCSREKNTYISQMFTILDLKKASSKLFSKKVYSLLKQSFASSQNNYPEILAQMFVINSGLMVKAGWSVIKAFIDEKTKKKIITCGSDFEKKLLEHVDKENLPKFLGGSCECQHGCLYSNAGPWNVKGEVQAPSAEILKLQENLKLQTEEETEEEADNGQRHSSEDDEDKAKLAELSKQLNDKVNFSDAQTANVQYKLENNEYEMGDTPINTQEVNSEFNLGRAIR